MASNQATPRVGSVWHDTSRGKDGQSGQVMACDFGRIYMRPLGGGVEWVTTRGNLVPLKQRVTS